VNAVAAPHTSSHGDFLLTVNRRAEPSVVGPEGERLSFTVQKYALLFEQKVYWVKLMKRRDLGA
jgi:hypothetical protein